MTLSISAMMRMVPKDCLWHAIEQARECEDNGIRTDGDFQLWVAIFSAMCSHRK